MWGVRLCVCGVDVRYMCVMCIHLFVMYVDVFGRCMFVCGVFVCSVCVSMFVCVVCLRCLGFHVFV